ncbi:hypothetical protein Cgig2_010371 [Carnegiea gigantea]|uniref:OTU domain-containing protein n=1 Tax=Carnegiea gigantea TaxID=171969 RepID=A0A9Q1QD18_9CARY|nr:hypothetical protein Cgig2_010371 [Carnegiea gigantea]
MVVQYIVKNREMFEPFIEDEIPFDEYCQSMEKDGTWAGHMELQAASLVTRNNICIHRHMSPRWYIRNFDNQGAHMIHLSYHDGEHYNSVRLKEDPCDGPARPIIIKADVNLTASLQQAKAAGASSKSRSSKNVVHGGTIKMVMAGSGCEDAEKAEQVLLQVDGDVDAAIEFLIAEQAAEETVNESNVFPEEDSNGNGENGTSDKHQNGNLGHGTDQSSNIKKVDNDKTSCKVDKVLYIHLQKFQKIPRNKVCPCGSKKKYKACCGTAASGKKFVMYAS